MASRVIASISMDADVKKDVEVLAGILGYSLSSYAARAIAEQVERDKVAFPKAFQAAVAAQEEIKEQKGA